MMIQNFHLMYVFLFFFSEFLRRKFEAEKQQLILENTDEKSGYQRLLKEFNRLEQKNENLEEELARYKGGNTHKVRTISMHAYISYNQY